MATIIGGPSIRKTSQNCFHIWLVLDASAKVDAVAKTSLNGHVIAQATTNSTKAVQLGKSLVVYLLKIAPPDGDLLPLDKKIYYDVTVDGHNLEEMGLISGDKPITYPGEKLPSLVIPTKHGSILQASCRKPHAKQSSSQSQRDQLTRGDDILADSINKPTSRPSMLLLTGDQIYADDVSGALLAGIIPKAKELVGDDEWIPDHRRKGKGFIPSKLKLYGRHKKLTRGVGFTSSHGKNHLITLGEFMAMYLAIWGGIEIEMPAWPKVHKNVAFELKKSSKKQGLKQVKEVTSTQYSQESERVQQFLDNSWKVRRLMANTPTYMMFDDHEVTDDWNLRADTAHNLASTPTGRRLSTNALAAYWACQGWGNGPDVFGPAFKNAVSAFYATLDYDAAAAVENKVLSHYWGYSIPGYPALVVLDTRTNRKFGNNPGPGLMSTKAFNWLEGVLKEFKNTYQTESGAQTLLVLSPAPFYGFKPIERIQERLVERYQGLDTIVDAEYWSADPPTKEKFLQTIAEYPFTRDILFLSGDVHYSYNLVEEIPVEGSTTPVRYFQLTCSASCNQLSDIACTLFDWITSGKIDKDSKYLYPEEHKSEFLRKHNNLGELQLTDGLPSKQILHFYNSDSQRNYKWTFDLT